jgi:hypothetical protein
MAVDPISHRPSLDPRRNGRNPTIETAEERIVRARHNGWLSWYWIRSGESDAVGQPVRDREGRIACEEGVRYDETYPTDRVLRNTSKDTSLYDIRRRADRDVKSRPRKEKKGNGSGRAKLNELRVGRFPFPVSRARHPFFVLKMQSAHFVSREMGRGRGCGV